MTDPLVILDADGVFLNERPYWETALMTALCANALPLPTWQNWRSFAGAALDELGVQRITKRHGCNSNWDLAAVLVRALSGMRTRKQFRTLLVKGRWRDAAAFLRDRADALWRGDTRIAPASRRALYDPLAGFGIDRNGQGFEEVRHTFQQLLSTNGVGASRCERGALYGRAVDIRATLTALVADSFDLAVCTGRGEAELLAPIINAGLNGFFDRRRLLTADDVSNAERSLGLCPLGKPHWFSVACAVLGPERAQHAVRTGSLRWTARAPIVYVADGWSDFLSARGARSVGLPIWYIHLRSGATDDDREQSIAEASFTLAVIDALVELPSVLRRLEVASLP